MMADRIAPYSAQFVLVAREVSYEAAQGHDHGKRESPREGLSPAWRGPDADARRPVISGRLRTAWRSCPKGEDRRMPIRVNRTIDMREATSVREG